MQELEHAISTIRVRFGSQALTRAAEMPPPQPWPSRTELDRLTGIGGLPRGRLPLLTPSGNCRQSPPAPGLLHPPPHSPPPPERHPPPTTKHPKHPPPTP